MGLSTFFGGGATGTKVARHVTGVVVLISMVALLPNQILSVSTQFIGDIGRQIIYSNILVTLFILLILIVHILNLFGIIKDMW